MGGDNGEKGKMFVKFVGSGAEKCEGIRKNGTCYFFAMNYNRNGNLIMGEEVILL